jgi:hypothetical protein
MTIDQHNETPEPVSSPENGGLPVPAGTAVTVVPTVHAIACDPIVSGIRQRISDAQDQIRLADAKAATLLAGLGLVAGAATQTRSGPLTGATWVALTLTGLLLGAVLWPRVDSRTPCGRPGAFAGRSSGEVIALIANTEHRMTLASELGFLSGICVAKHRAIRRALVTGAATLVLLAVAVVAT